MFKNSSIYKNIISFYDERVTHKIFLHENYEKLKSFKNLHKGESCYIIGNGPSLLSCDLDKLSDCITFGSNYIFKVFDKTSWRPTYYVNSDLGVLSKMILEEDFWNMPVQNMFFQFNSRYVFKKKLPHKFCCYYLREAKNYNKFPKFASNITDEIFDSYTVTYIYLQIACYMGFEKIYLLGIDHNYSVEISNDGKINNTNATDSFIKGKSYKDLGGATPNVERMNMGYISAKKFADKHGIKIYNATRGGKLEAFERVDFDKIFIKGE